MKQHAKRKPWSESHQTIVCCSVLVALMALGIWAIDRYVPKSPMPMEARAHLSLQEARR